MQLKFTGKFSQTNRVYRFSVFRKGTVNAFPNSNRCRSGNLIDLLVICNEWCDTLRQKSKPLVLTHIYLESITIDV